MFPPGPDRRKEVRMWTRTLLGGLVGTAVLAGVVWLLAGAREAGQVELLNVSYDPTRELYEDLNARFVPRYEQETGTRLTISQSHGGSGTQARQVIDGLPADV